MKKPLLAFAIVVLTIPANWTAKAFDLSDLNNTTWCDAEHGCTDPVGSQAWQIDSLPYMVRIRTPNIIELWRQYSKDGPGLHFRGTISGSTISGTYYPLAANSSCANRAASLARTVAGTFEPSRISLSLPALSRDGCSRSNGMNPPRNLTIVPR